MQGSARSSLRSQGFTLVEIMVVVVIVGLLAMLATQSYFKIHHASLGARFISDLRTFCMQFDTFSVENGGYPADTNPGQMPPEIANQISERWLRETSIGGQWDWDYLQFGVVAGVSVHGPTFTDEEMAKIDAKIDDGNLSSGIFRQRSGGYIRVLEF